MCNIPTDISSDANFLSLIVAEVASPLTITTYG